MSLHSANELSDTISLTDSEEEPDVCDELAGVPPLVKPKVLRFFKILDDFDKKHSDAVEKKYYINKLHDYFEKHIRRAEKKAWSRDYAASSISEIPSVSFRGGRGDVSSLGGSIYSHRMGYPPSHIGMGIHPYMSGYNRPYFPNPLMDYSGYYPPMPPPLPASNLSFSMAPSVRSASFYDNSRYVPPRHPMDSWSHGPPYMPSYHEPSYEPAPSVYSQPRSLGTEVERPQPTLDRTNKSRSYTRHPLETVVEESEMLNMSSSFPKRLSKSRSVENLNGQEEAWPIPSKDESTVKTTRAPSGAKEKSMNEKNASGSQLIASTSRVNESVAQAETTYTLVDWTLVKGPGMNDVQCSGNLLDKNGKVISKNHLSDFIVSRMKGLNNVKTRDGNSYTLIGPLKDTEKSIPQEVKNYFKGGKFPILWRKATAIWHSYIVNTSGPSKSHVSPSDNSVSSTTAPEQVTSKGPRGLQKNSLLANESIGSSRYGRTIQPARDYWQNDKDVSSFVSKSLEENDTPLKQRDNKSGGTKRKPVDDVPPVAKKKMKGADGEFLVPALPRALAKKATKPAEQKKANSSAPASRRKGSPNISAIEPAKQKKANASGPASRRKGSPNTSTACKSSSEDKENKGHKKRGRPKKNPSPAASAKKVVTDAKLISHQKDSEELFPIKGGCLFDFQLDTKSYSPNSILNSVKKYYKKSEETMIQTPPSKIFSNFMQSKSHNASTHSTNMELDTSINSAPRNSQLLKRVIRDDKKKKKKSPARPLLPSSTDDPPEVAEALAALKSKSAATPTILKTLFRNESTSDFSDG